MQDEIVSFKTAKLAKEKNFENLTPHKLRRDYYNHLGVINGDVSEYVKAYVNKKDTTLLNTIDAPTQSLLKKWLREKHDILVYIWRNTLTEKYRVIEVHQNNEEVSFKHEDDEYDTYEEAMEIGLVLGLNLIKNV